MNATGTATLGSTTSAAELLEVLDDVALRLAALPVSSPTSGAQEAWVEVARATQRIVNTATGLQDEAIVRLSAIELVEGEDGTVGQVHKAPGHIALDAPALVSFALEVTAVHAERQVRSAIRLAADGPTGTTTCTGLGALHDAMRAGTLDAYRAGVVATELEEAPPEVAETVIATLGEHLTRETGPQLRRRTQRLLARISPDLLRRRATRARSQCSLRRWVAEPGVDQWEGTFPSEDAARAWAAIDRRAQELVAAGTCERVDRARAQALIDLVTASATITTVVTIAVPGSDSNLLDPAGEPTADRSVDATADGGEQAPPTHATSAQAARTPAGHAADARHGAADPSDLLEVPNPLGGEPILVARAWLDALLTDPATTVQHATCDPITGALRSTVTTGSYRPPKALAARVRRRDGRCRFPGCSVAARFCDLDHVRPWPVGPTSDDNLVCLCRRHHRIKQLIGWHVTLHPDATLTWTDPTGRRRTTRPVDTLRGLTLSAPAPTDPVGGAAVPTTQHTIDPEDAPHSGLEFAVEHVLGAVRPAHPTTLRRERDRHQSGVGVDLVVVRDQPAALTRRACLRSRRRRPNDFPDTPPF